MRAMDNGIDEALQDLTVGQFDEYKKLFDDIEDSYGKMIRANNKREKQQYEKLFQFQLSKMEELEESFEDIYTTAMDSMEDMLLYNIDTEYNEKKKAIKKYNKLYENMLKKNNKSWKNTFDEINESMEEVSEQFGSVAEIASAIHLGEISDAITDGAQSVVEVMEEVSKARGLSSEEVKLIKDSIGSDELAGGYISKSDILALYGELSVTSDYLDDIRSNVAIFEEATGVQSDQLDEMLVAMENMGRSSDEVNDILDQLSNVRMEGIHADVGEVTESLSSVINSIDEGNEQSYINAQAIASSNKIDMSLLEEAVKQGTIYGNEDMQNILAHTASVGGIDIQEADKLLKEGNYEELMARILTSMDEVVEVYGHNEDVLNSVAQSMGMENTNTLRALANIEDEKIANALDALNNNQTTLVEQAENGFKSTQEKFLNELGGTLVGDISEGFKEFAYNNPLLTAVGAQGTLALGKWGLGKIFGKGAATAAGGTGLFANASTMLKSAGSTFMGFASKAGTALTSAASKAGTAISSGASQAGTAISGALSSVDWMGLTTTASNVMSTLGPYLPALPDAVRATQNIVEDQSSWNSLSDSEKERLLYSGDARTQYSNAFTGQLGSRDGLDETEYLEALQENIRSNSNDWVSGWVDTYWREFDGELESAYDNYLNRILSAAEVDIGQSDWDASTTKEEIEQALINMTEAEKENILNTLATTSGSGQFKSTAYALGSENDLASDIRDALVKEYQEPENERSYRYAIEEVLRAHGQTREDYTNAEMEELLQEALGNDYERNAGHWWKYGDGDNSTAGGYGGLYFNEQFVNDSFNSALQDIIDGSHANGLSYVPFDNYLANLHEGERVLTRSENEDYSRIKESDNSSTELLEIVKVLKNGFEFIGKKIDSVEVRVQTLEKSARTSQVSSIFARGSI